MRHLGLVPPSAQHSSDVAGELVVKNIPIYTYIYIYDHHTAITFYPNQPIATNAQLTILWPCTCLPARGLLQSWALLTSADGGVVAEDVLTLERNSQAWIPLRGSSWLQKPSGKSLSLSGETNQNQVQRSITNAADETFHLGSWSWRW